MTEAFVYLGLAGIAGIVWLVRLEGQYKQSAMRIDQLQRQVDIHLDRDEIQHAKMLDELSEIKETTAEIRGFLKK